MRPEKSMNSGLNLIGLAIEVYLDAISALKTTRKKLLSALAYNSRVAQSAGLSDAGTYFHLTFGSVVKISVTLLASKNLCLAGEIFGIHKTLRESLQH